MSDKKNPSPAGEVELSESHLDEVSGGPHFKTFDSDASVKVTKKAAASVWPNGWKVSELNGKSNT